MKNNNLLLIQTSASGVDYWYIPTAIIDVDNTLWDFATQLSLLFKEQNLVIPHWSEWNHWDFYKEYMPDKQFKEFVAKVHRNQRFHKPFNGASKLLNLLFRQGLLIHIISHRDKKFTEPLKRYLYKYDLPCDRISCTFKDKFSLLPNNEVCSWVIDDSPIILEKALELKVPNIMGLKYPWNKHLEKRVKLFDSMEEMNAYIQFKHLFSKGEINGSK